MLLTGGADCLQRSQNESEILLSQGLRFPVILQPARLASLCYGPSKHLCHTTELWLLGEVGRKCQGLAHSHIVMY